MEKLGSFKSALLASAVALSVLASPVSAVSEAEVRKFLSQNSVSSQNVDKEVLNNLEKFDVTQWEQFKNIAQSLTEGMDGWERAQVIKALGNVAPENWPQFMKSAKFLTKDVNVCNRANVIEALEKIAPEKWTWFVEIKKLPTEGMSEFDYANVNKALWNVAPGGTWPWFIALYRLIRTSGIDKDRHVQDIVNTVLLNVTPKPWPRFVKTEKLLECMNVSDHAKVISALSNVAPGSWTWFIAISRLLMTPDMTVSGCADVIEALGNNVGRCTQFIETAEMLTKNMNGDDRAWAISALGKVTPEKWDEFVKTVKSLTEGMERWKSNKVIAALGELDLTILFHPEFSKGITPFVNMIESVFDKVKALNEIAKHGSLFQNPESVSYYDLFRQLRGGSSLVRYNSIVQALSQIPEGRIQNENFFPTITSLITPGVDIGSRAKVIEALRKVAPEKWPQFVAVAESLTGGKDGFTRGWVIEALGDVAPEKLFHEKFLPTAELLTKDMIGDDCAWAIEVLGAVPKDKIDTVYGQIRRLLGETQGKIYLTRFCAGAKNLIQQLQACDTDVQALVFTTDLIAKVNDHLGNVDDNALLTHINSAWKSVQKSSIDELQALANQGQKSSTTPEDNTSHEEVNARGASTQNVPTENTEDPTLTLKRRSLSPSGSDRDVE